MSDIDKELIYWVVLSAFFMPLLLFGILIWFIHVYQTKKYQHEVFKRDSQIQNQNMIIDHQKAIEEERTRIATEMHDDLGSGLTSIKYLSEKLESKLRDPELMYDMSKIGQYSTDLIKNMSEIIWALNDRFDHIKDLIGYLRRYVSEYLEERGIACEFIFKGDIPDHGISGERRRNIFLVVKELVHNAVKHSGAQKLSFYFELDSSLTIEIREEGGIGFDPEEKAVQGNGIYNIMKRLKSIGAEISFECESNGMRTTIYLLIENMTTA